MKVTITRTGSAIAVAVGSLLLTVPGFAQNPKPTGYWTFVDVTMKDTPSEHPAWPSSMTGKRGAVQSTSGYSASGKIVWTEKTDWIWSDPPGVLVPGELVTMRLGYKGGPDLSKPKSTAYQGVGTLGVDIETIGLPAGGVSLGNRFYPQSFLETDGVTFKKDLNGDWCHELTNCGIQKTQGKYLAENNVDYVGKVTKYKGDPRANDPNGKWISLRVGITHKGHRIYHYNYKWVEGPPPKDGITIPPAADGQTTSGTANDTGNTSQPPTDASEPANTSKFTIQAGKRVAKSGETVQVPVFLLNPGGVGNLNTTVSYTSSIATAEGKPIRGNVLGSSLFEANTAEAGIARVGFAGSKPLTESGILAHITFKAVGKPGDRTILKVAVTTANSSDGKPMTAETIDGEVIIVGEGGKIPGDHDGDGVITASDALSALKMSVKLIPENMNLDMDKDAKVTSNDARLILLKAVGK